jgi:hypothetical protein
MMKKSTNLSCDLCFELPHDFTSLSDSDSGSDTEDSTSEQEKLVDSDEIAM